MNAHLFKSLDRLHLDASISLRFVILVVTVLALEHSAALTSLGHGLPSFETSSSLRRAIITLDFLPSFGGQATCRGALLLVASIAAERLGFFLGDVHRFEKVSFELGQIVSVIVACRFAASLPDASSPSFRPCYSGGTPSGCSLILTSFSRG